MISSGVLPRALVLVVLFITQNSLRAQDIKVRPYYEQSFTETADRPAIEKATLQNLAKARARIADFTAFASDAKERKNLIAEAFAKRLEIYKSLIDYVEKSNSEGADSFLFARQGARELEALIHYFDDEIARSGVIATDSPLEINIVDLGAKGDGVTDDGPALRSALARALAHGGGTRIYLPQGRYLINSLVTAEAPPASMSPAEVLQSWGLWRDVHLAILNQRDLTIEGAPGVTILCSDPTRTAISILGSRNVLIKNVAIDYASLPFTQGTIVDLDLKNQSIVWKKDEGYPDPTQPNFLNAVERRGLPYSAKTGKVGWSGGDKFLGNVEALGEGKFRVEIKRGSLSALTRGSKFGMIARFDGGGSAINMRSSFYCTLENVAVYSSPGVAFMAGSSSALSLVNCVVEPLPGSDRLISSNGDGFQYTNGIIGPFVKGCRFRGMHDDGFMVSTRCTPIRSINDERNILATTPGMIRAGDEVAILSATEGTVKMEVHVQSVKEDASGGEFTLAEVIPNIQTMKDLGMKELGHKEMHEYYTGARKFASLPDYALNLNLSNSATVITGSSFSEHRGVGVKIQAPNALVEDNTIEGVQSVGIAVSGILTWREPFGVHNVIVRGNTVKNVPIGFATHYTLSPGRDAECLSLRSLRFVGNRLDNVSRIFVNLENCFDVQILGNQFRRSPSGSEINIGRAMRVTLDGNSFSPREALPDATFSN